MNWKSFVRIIFGTGWETDGRIHSNVNSLIMDPFQKIRLLPANLHVRGFIYSLKFLSFFSQVWLRILFLEGHMEWKGRQMHWWPKPSLPEEGLQNALNASNSRAKMRANGQVWGTHVLTLQTPVHSWDYFQTLLGSATVHTATKSSANTIFKVGDIRHLQWTSPLYFAISGLNLNDAIVTGNPSILVAYNYKDLFLP